MSIHHTFRLHILSYVLLHHWASTELTSRLTGTTTFLFFGICTGVTSRKEDIPILLFMAYNESVCVGSAVVVDGSGSSVYRPC